jgi:hypothetical protein
MTEKKAEQKPFNPIEKAIGDAWDVGFFGDRHFNIQKLCANCRRRGLVGTDVWSQRALSAPLKLLQQASKDLTEDQVDALLNEFAKAIGFDASLVKRHYYSIKFQVEDQFLTTLEQQEKKRRKLEELAQEAENEEIPLEEDQIEENEGEEE